MDAPGLGHRARRMLLAKWKRQGATCAYCLTVAADTVDHVIPLSRGGDNYEGNLVPACRRCNASKCDLLLIEWRTTGVLGSSVQRAWRPDRLTPKRRPRKPEVQSFMCVCVICGGMYVSPERLTCGDLHCQREHLGRYTRDKYRTEHGLVVDPTEPTIYWIRLHGLDVPRRRARKVA